MELVQEKYKQTEVGIIPSDWEVISLGEIFDFKNGLNKEKQFFGYGTPIVNYMDVFNSSGILSKDIKGKVFLNNQEIKNYEVRKGDVFFTRTSETVEEIGISTVILDDVIDTVFSGFILRGRTKNDILDLNFKKYCFSSSIVRKEIITTASYTTRALTNGRLLSNVRLPIPKSIEEQNAIATALSDADNWINSLEQLIAKKRLIKQGVMQELLKSKEGWEVKKLGEICDVIIGLTYSPNDVCDHGTLVLRSSNIQNNKLAFENNVFVKMDLPQRVIVKENDILVCVRNGSKQLIGKCALVDKKNEGHAFGAFMSIIRSEYNKYIYHYFLSNIIQIQIDENMGATINQLTNATLKSFDIYLPNKSEQTRIATILNDMDAEITSLEEKLEKAKQVKLGMMQELLTGRIRLL